MVVRSAIGSACARPSAYDMIVCASTPSSLARQVDVLGERVRMCHCVRLRASCRAGGVGARWGWGWEGGEMVHGRMEGRREGGNGGGGGGDGRAYVVGAAWGSGMARKPRPRRGVGVGVGLVGARCHRSVIGAVVVMCRRCAR